MPEVVLPHAEVLKHIIKLERGPMPNVMAALLNIGGTLGRMPQFG